MLFLHHLFRSFPSIFASPISNFQLILLQFIRSTVKVVALCGKIKSRIEHTKYIIVLKENIERIVKNNKEIVQTIQDIKDLEYKYRISIAIKDNKVNKQLQNMVINEKQ